MAACLLLLATGSMLAQEAKPAPLPDAPSLSAQSLEPQAQSQRHARADAVVFHKKVFWVLVVVDAASTVADDQTSLQNEKIFPRGSEQNSWLLGRRPSAARYYATDAVIDGGGAFLSFKLLHSRRKLFRTAGWILLAGLVERHSEGWIHNLSVR